MFGLGQSHEHQSHGQQEEHRVRDIIVRMKSIEHRKDDQRGDEETAVQQDLPPAAPPRHDS